MCLIIKLKLIMLLTTVLHRSPEIKPFLKIYGSGNWVREPSTVYIHGGKFANSIVRSRVYIEDCIYTITSFSGDFSICPIKIPVVSTQATGPPMGSASGWGYKNRVIYMAPDYKYLITYWGNKGQMHGNLLVNKIVMDFEGVWATFRERKKIKSLE